jgi:hypothetical protein
MGQQQDSYEIMCRFLELLDVHEPATTLFLFETEIQISCRTVSYGRRLPNERFRSISLEISNQSSVCDIIKQTMIQVLEGNDQWNTESSHGMQDATLRRTIIQAPTVLQLHLKRFTFDGYGEKVLHCATFGQELLLETSGGSAKYCLSSVLVHTGTLASGHFYSFVKKSKSWFRCDDNRVIEVSVDQAIDENFGGKKKGREYIKNQPTAYVLIYVLDSADDSSAEPVIAKDMQEKYQTCVQHYRDKYVKHGLFLKNLVEKQCMHCWYVLETLFRQSSDSFRVLFDGDRLHPDQSSQNGLVEILNVAFDPNDTIQSALMRSQLQVSNDFDMLHLHLLRERSHSNCQQSEKNLSKCSFAATVEFGGTQYHLQSVVVHATGKPYVIFTKPNCWPHWFRCSCHGHISEVDSEVAIEDNFGGMMRQQVKSGTRSNCAAALIPSQSTAQILLYVKESVTVAPHPPFDSDLTTIADFVSPDMKQLLTEVTADDLLMFEQRPLASPFSEAQAVPESLLKFVVQRKDALPLQGRINNDHVSDCLSMFAILRQDTLFILPIHCFSISLHPNQSQNWPRSFTRFVSKYNFNYVVAMLSIDPSGNASNSNDSQETRWVASVGNVAHKRAWYYGPSKNSGLYKSPLLINILSAVMTYKTKKEFTFQKSGCPVKHKFRCSHPSDNTHCGIWSLMLIQNWCTYTVQQYIDHVKDMSLESMITFAKNCREQLISDLEKGVADSSMMFCPPISKVKSSFWTFTKQMHFAYCLKGKFGGDFQEQCFQDGTLKTLDPNDGMKCEEDGNPRESVHFFTSQDSFVKVYRILLGSSDHASTSNLAKALHEASATAYVCPKYKWRCEVFGIVTQGVHASYLHVCILRSLLNAAGLSEEKAQCAFISLLERWGVVHGDPHVGNAKMKLGLTEIELIDLERSFLLGSGDKADIISSTREYVNNANARHRLLEKMRKQGMDDVRKRFCGICKNQIDLLKLELKDFLKIFDPSS